MENKRSLHFFFNGFPTTQVFIVANYILLNSWGSLQLEASSFVIVCCVHTTRQGQCGRTLNWKRQSR